MHNHTSAQKKNSTKQRCAIQNRRTLFTCNSKSYPKHSITSFHIISKDFVRSTWLTESTWSHTCDSLARLFNSETKKRERKKTRKQERNLYHKVGHFSSRTKKSHIMVECQLRLWRFISLANEKKILNHGKKMMEWWKILLCKIYFR